MERVIFSAFGFGISLWSTIYYGKSLVEAWHSYELGRPVQVNYIVEHIVERDDDSDYEVKEEDSDCDEGEDISQ